jgi:D-arabinose 1-dehydrogenase-like Zn-dependent alcohol dehydrogenase
MPKMRAVQVARGGGPFELVERDIPEPGPGLVRIKVEACGVCHSDVFAKEGAFPGIRYPVVPGHEVAGVIDAVGAGVGPWQAGQPLASVGTAATTGAASRAGAAISSPAATYAQMAEAADAENRDEIA